MKFINIFFSVLIVNISCNSIQKPNFNNDFNDLDYLNGEWKLKKIGVFDRNKKIDFYIVDSTNYNYQILNIDTDKMLYNIKNYPFIKFEPSYPVSISGDTIYIKSGTTINNELVMLIKNKIIFKISDDLMSLKLTEFNGRNIKIFSKN